MKFILWGYPLHTDTYSYVHDSFKKTLEYLGYEVYWFDDLNYPKDFDYDNCVFITEGYADKDIPLRKTSTYIVHVCVNPEKYLGNVKKLIDMRYHQKSMDNDNYEFILDESVCEKLDSGVLYDPIDSKSKGYEICYLAWATDLLPYEINDDWVNIEREDVYYFIGSISGDGRFANATMIQEFAQCCDKIGVKFGWSNPWQNPLDNEVMREYMQKSFLSPDLRNETHKKWGTKSCRIFKSISYGQLGLTNSPLLAEFAGPEVICRENIIDLFEEGLKYKDDKELILRQMNYVRENHTYLNRVNGLLKLL